MTTVDVDGKRFTFPTGWDVLVYDEWSFYRNKLCRRPMDARGSDVVAIAPGASTLYLIEAKDYTHPPGTTMPELQELADTVVSKTFDTLAGLAAGAKVVSSQQQLCRAAMQCDDIVMALSVEPPGHANGQLWQTKILSDLQTLLRRTCRFIDRRPLVVSNRLDGAPWTSAAAPRPR